MEALIIVGGKGGKLIFAEVRTLDNGARYSELPRAVLTKMLSKSNFE